MSPVLTAILILGAVGAVAAIVLVLAAKYMAVKEDERFPKVRECLPGANCGACGYAGCDGYAQALVDGTETRTNLCVPGADGAAHALADVLGLTLADLMHCHDSRQKDATPPVPLEDFFTMLRRQHTVDWRSVRTALLALSIALALWGIFACPGRLAVHWRTLSDGSLQADGWMSSLVIFPLFAGFEFLSLELWNNFEQTGYYRRWGEVNLFIIHAMSFGTPLTRLMRLVLDLLFFFCFGFLLPYCEAWLILLN